MTQTELAAEFGVSRRTLMDWDREGLADAARVTKKPVKYDPVRAWRWRWENKREMSTSQKDAKVRKLEAEAAVKELEFAERRGQLVHVDVVRRTFGDVFARVRSRLFALKGSLPPRLTGLETPRDVVAILGPGIDEAIAELDAAVREAEPEDDAPDDEAAA